MHEQHMLLPVPWTAREPMQSYTCSRGELPGKCMRRASTDAIIHLQMEGLLVTVSRSSSCSATLAPLRSPQKISTQTALMIFLHTTILLLPQALPAIQQEKASHANDTPPLPLAANPHILAFLLKVQGWWLGIPPCSLSPRIPTLSHS
jgi:hypothetical protein